MLLKISPDLERNELDDIISLISELKIDGVIATNTSISRDNVKSKFKNETGTFLNEKTYVENELKNIKKSLLISLMEPILFLVQTKMF